MNQLRLLAPVSVDFATVPGSASRDPEGYARFWLDVSRGIANKRDLPADVTVSIHHTEVVRAVNRYATIDRDALGQTVHLATIQCEAAAVLDDHPLLDSISNTTLQLFDHGVAMLEVDLEPGEIPSTDADMWLDKLQADAVGLAEALARGVVETRLRPVLTEVRELDPDDAFVVPALPEDDIARNELGEVMWVTRSLLVSENDRAALGHWTKDVTGATETDVMRAHLLDGRSDRLVRWLNYAFVDVDDQGVEAWRSGRFADHWEALRYAQVTYAVLDRIDSRLALVLAEAAAATERWQLEELRERLVELSGRAEVAIMERQHLAKYLKRAVRTHMEEILAGWDYTTLLEEPVQFKIRTCTRRLGELTAKRTARSSVVTDLILLGIGVTSIGSIALAIIDFGRSSVTDPLSTGYDLGGSGFTSWFAAQPIDAILMVSGIISVLLVILYLYFRRDDGQ